MQASATILIGIIVSMCYTWKMTLVSLVSVPMVIVAVVLEGRVLAEGIATIREASNKATTIATEAITNIRTVSAFCKYYCWSIMFEGICLSFHFLILFLNNNFEDRHGTEA